MIDSSVSTFDIIQFKLLKKISSVLHHLSITTVCAEHNTGCINTVVSLTQMRGL